MEKKRDCAQFFLLLWSSSSWTRGSVSLACYSLVAAAYGVVCVASSSSETTTRARKTGEKNRKKIHTHTHTTASKAGALSYQSVRRTMGR